MSLSMKTLFIYNINIKNYFQKQVIKKNLCFLVLYTFINGIYNSFVHAYFTELFLNGRTDFDEIFRGYLSGSLTGLDLQVSPDRRRCDRVLGNVLFIGGSLRK